VREADQLQGDEIRVGRCFGSIGHDRRAITVTKSLLFATDEGSPLPVSPHGVGRELTSAVIGMSLLFRGHTPLSRVFRTPLFASDVDDQCGR
jgi:hypothetical protein